MHSTRRTLLLSLPAALAVAGVFGAGRSANATPSASEHKVIDKLIDRLGAKRAMIFIRNDSQHDAADAVKHLRAKFNHFKSRIVTAEDFIELCATRSEMTGELYKVREGNGPLRNAGEYLREELRAVRAELGKAG